MKSAKKGIGVHPDKFAEVVLLWVLAGLILLAVATVFRQVIEWGLMSGPGPTCAACGLTKRIASELGTNCEASSATLPDGGGLLEQLQ